ncbi:hypothetical protein MNBD_CPR01-180 [hydrothermal vent metagenome]|uniref:Uncharacterized protein n=1 Tax=hydrothermal vent metagenome TaxID=652676 RepID=A0A3B0VMQ7_9ZZZZ
MEKENHSDSESKTPPVSTVTQQSWGAVLAIFIILIMIVLGAIYAWNKRVASMKTITANQPASIITASTTNSISVQK